MDDHPSLLGINAFARQVLEEARRPTLDDDPTVMPRPASPMRITLSSGNHWIERIVDVDHHSDPDLEQEIVASVIQSMIFRLRFKVSSPPASWTWTCARVNVMEHHD